MNIDLPPWVSHDGQSIYAVDIDSIAAAEDAEGDNPRLLATLTEHTAPVNTVRFSRSSKFLATCSDDTLAYVFELQPGPGKTVFGGPASLENWKLILPLRGHSNNVVDVSWSPDDKLLATCSLDNTIIIWNSLGAQLAILEGHTSYVKGIAWDPIGSYLASQSDDKSVIIWRCSDWNRITQITAPFRQGFISQTFSLRLSWSSDGQYLVAANSFQSPSHCACVLSRGDWDSSFSIVGHKAAVTVVRFNPLLFQDPTGSSEPACCFAMGSQDSKVTVWLTAGDRPRVILSKTFVQSVTDLAWTRDGHALIACSTDGRVAVLRVRGSMCCPAQFSKGTLGEPLGSKASRAYLSKLYGQKQPGGQVLLPESAAQLQAEQRKLVGSPQDAEAQQAKQVLQPPSQRAAKQVPQPPAAGAQPGPSKPTGKGVSARLGEPHSSGAALSKGTPDRAEFPVAVLKPPGQGKLQSAYLAASVVHAAVREAPIAVQQERAFVRREKICPEEAVGQRRPAPASLASSRPAKTPRRISAEPMAEAPHSTPRSQAGQGPLHQPGFKAFPNPQPPPRALSVVLGGEQGPGEQTPQRLEIINSGNMAHVTCHAAQSAVWRDSFSGSVVKACGSHCFSAVVLQDGSMHVYSSAGRRLLPSVMLSSSAAFLCARGDWKLLAVLLDGSVRVWDMQQQKLLVKATLAPFRGLEVTAARLTQHGLPLVLLADGSAHVLHRGLEEWLCIVHPSFAALPFASSMHGMGGVFGGELSRVEAEASTSATAMRPPHSAEPRDTSNDSRRHIESQLAAARVLESPSEYRRWLLTYIRQLSGDADETSLRELCWELLGPIREPADGPSTWERSELGFDKRALLKEALREVARHRTHQGLITEFTDFLQAAEEPG